MKRPLVSIIIPIYNCKKYISKMVESVLSQTEGDFELLLVDNNSNDGTAQLLKMFADKDARIQVLKQPKQGVSAARNKALEVCKGKYILFLDGDDWIDADYLKMLLDGIQGVDYVACGYRAYFEKGKENALYYECFYESPKEEKTEYSAEEMLERLFLVTNYQGYVWNKLFVGDIIRQHHLCFDEDIAYNEDRLFSVRYLQYCKLARMVYSNKYHYILHAGNAVSADQGEFPVEKEFTEIEAFDRMLNVLDRFPKALRLAQINMAERELLLFGRMLDIKGFARYRKSQMRNHARRFSELKYQPKDAKEAKLCRKFVLYGWTGISYGKNE